MLSKGGGFSNLSVKTADNILTPTKLSLHQNALHTMYPPHNSNNLVRHHQSGEGQDSRLGWFQKPLDATTLNHRPIQRPSLSNPPGGLPPPPGSFAGSSVHGGTNTWPYRPQEVSLQWTSSDLMAMQSIFGRGPLDMTLFSAFSASTTTPVDTPRGGQPTSTWPSNENRIGAGFGRTDPTQSPAGGRIQQLYGGNNMWSTNRGGSYGTGDAWGANYSMWNADRFVKTLLEFD